MAQMFLGLLGGGAGAAAGTAGVAAGTAGVAAGTATGISLSSVLQGAVSVLGMVSSIAAGNADAEAYKAQAEDVQREQPLETLKGIDRRSAIRREMVDALGKQDVAYAASGTDLSFGTPGQARQEAYRQADSSLEVDQGTQATTQARLTEKRSNYLKMASRAKASGVLNAVMTGIQGFSALKSQGGK